MSAKPIWKKTSYRLTVVAIVLIFLIGFRLAEDIGPERRPEDRFLVVRVIDGDTMELAGGDKLRLRSIDTPERGERLFDEARLRLEELTLGRQLRLVFTGQRRDRYGRLLAFAYIDSILVNEALVAEGLAYVFLFEDSPMDSPELQAVMAAQRSAVVAERGLMASAQDPESFYLAAPGSFRFHRPACRSAARHDISSWRQLEHRRDALLEGLTPCRHCRP